ncbi:MAG: cbb3-type cytochrome c oxidase subunit II, partial [Acidimicrobiia bacterium]|nr:cbb3-type cytochrome c oxidase subunit II [Acidimicrobiia bacterium]
SVNAETTAAGDAFRSSVVPLEAMRMTAFVGVALLALGILAFLAAVLIGVTSRARIEESAPSTGAGSGVTPIWQGALLLFTLAGLAVFALPAIDVGAEPSSLAATTREHPDASPQARGREIYLAEGCWQCHTQQVRSIVADVGLGAVSVPGDYVYDGGDLLGSRRIGPDLTHLAGRGWDFPSLLAHLSNPREARPWSVMPSYGYLSAEELEYLAFYLAGLE